MAANIRNNRKEIDEFLVTLDAFMERYRKDYKEMYKVYVPIFKVNSHLNKGGPKKGSLPVPTLARYCNNKLSHAPELGTKHSRNVDPFDIMKKERTDSYVRTVAYGLEWEYVQDLSLEHVFRKYALSMGFVFEDKYAVYPGHLARFPLLPKILVPVDWNINRDLVIW